MKARVRRSQRSCFDRLLPWDLASTMISRWWLDVFLKASLVIRLNRFRQTALLIFLLPTMTPNLPCSDVPLLAKTMKQLSWCRYSVCLKTQSYAARSWSLLVTGKSCARPVIFLSLYIFYADNSCLPLALRRFKTSRPALVDIRERNPWVRLRFNTLG